MPERLSIRQQTRDWMSRESCAIIADMRSSWLIERSAMRERLSIRQLRVDWMARVSCAIIADMRACHLDRIIGETDCQVGELNVY